MLTLNLPYPERSDIKFEIINFPDGHKHLKILDVPVDKDEIKIFLRTHSMDDIFIAMQAVSILRKNNNPRICIINPYAFGSRCDRRFSVGEAIDFDIIKNIVNSFAIASWESYDVHGSSSPGEKTREVFDMTCGSLSDKNLVIAYPDLGAMERYIDEPKSTPIHGRKIRDGKDKLYYESIYNAHLIQGRNILVRDDIIDGGLTFIEFAKLLKQQGAANLYLHATHAIFSKGTEEILKYYEHIFCTNSYKDIVNENITCYDVYI